MGFQDRDYNRYEPYNDYGYRRSRDGSLSVTMYLILINVALWVVNGFFFEGNSLTALLAIAPGTWNTPENWWKLLTYGFVHAPNTFWHLAGNMLGLVMFGYGIMLGLGPGGIGLVRGENIENRLGRAEYLVFYLLTIIFSGTVYAILNPTTSCVGASGGVTGLVILYAFFYPRKTLLLWGILPLPMWAIGLLIVFMDAGGASGISKDGIAYSAHLAGAFFALLYYFVFASHHQKITDSFTGWGKSFRKMFKKKPKLHIYTDKDNLANTHKTSVEETKTEKNEDFEKRLDEILGRYGKVGEAGLTKEEREFLQDASKKYRSKNKSNPF